MTTKTAPSRSELSGRTSSGTTSIVDGELGRGKSQAPLKKETPFRAKQAPRFAPTIGEMNGVTQGSTTTNYQKRSPGLEFFRKTYDEVVSSRTLSVLAAFVGTLTILCGAVAYGVASLEAPQYGARADLLYRLSSSQPTGFLREDRNLTTQVIIARSRAVLLPVARRHDLSIEQMEKKVAVSVLPESSVLRIEVKDRSRNEALKLVSDLAQEYLKRTENTALKGEIGYLRDQAVKLDKQIAKFRSAENASSLIVSEFEGLLAERSAVESRLQQRRVDALNARQAEPIADPYGLSGAVSPHPKLAAVGGALFGALISGLGAVFLLGWKSRVGQNGT
jgi:capsular polysaccharide biosynthesis protein